MPEILSDVVQAALHPDPALRASLWYVKEHAWLHIPVSKADYRFQVRPHLALQQIAVFDYVGRCAMH